MLADKFQFIKQSKIILGDHYGQNLPQAFAEQFRHEPSEEGPHIQGIDPEDLACIAKGPWDEEAEQANEWYWEAWDSILSSAYYVDKDGLKWTFYQDGDLWAIPDLATGWLGVGESSYDVNALDAVAADLATGRAHRLAGRMQLALIHEASAESALWDSSGEHADLLLSVWEGSMACDPYDVPEWQTVREGDEDKIAELYNFDETEAEFQAKV